MKEAKKLYVKSFGCQMNVYDSQRMADTLAPEGYVETPSPDDADIAGRRVTVAVAGCVAQAEGEEILRRAPAVDLVVGPQSYHRLPDLLKRAERQGTAIDTEFPVDDKFNHLAAPS